jgi:hypothetical protein
MIKTDPDESTYYGSRSLNCFFAFAMTKKLSASSYLGLELIEKGELTKDILLAKPNLVLNRNLATINFNA